MFKTRLDIAIEKQLRKLTKFERVVFTSLYGFDNTETHTIEELSKQLNVQKTIIISARNSAFNKLKQRR